MERNISQEHKRQPEDSLPFSQQPSTWSHPVPD